MARGDRGGDYRGKGWRVCRNNYKGHMENNKEGWKQGREVGRAGEVEEWRKRQKTVLEQQ